MTFLAIQLYPREAECIVCGVDCTGHHKGVPMYEGDVLPDDWPGEWGGFDACDSCFAKQQRLTAPASAAELLVRP